MMGQPTAPPPDGQTTLGTAWSWLRGLPMWAQVAGWVFLWPLLAALFIASPPNPSRARYATAAAVLLVGGAWWISLAAEEPVDVEQDLAVDQVPAVSDDVDPEARSSAEEPTREPSDEPEPEPDPEPDPVPASAEPAEPEPDPAPGDDDAPVDTGAGSGWTVVNVVDGDTLDVRNAAGVEQRIRVIGIDTPERGECGYGEASLALADLLMGETVNLVAGARDDRDRYDRVLRYVDVGDTDAGRVLLELGLARSRYDSRDGYGPHPREGAYVAADEAMPDITCEFGREPEPEPEPTQAAPVPVPEPVPAPANPWGASSCHAAYEPCVPPVSDVGDLNCPDIRVVHPGGVAVDLSIGDPHGLDGDKDGSGCE